MPEIAGPITATHNIEACYGSRLHCWIHHADEPPEGYRWCLECGHMYVTEAELVAAHNKEMDVLSQFGPGESHLPLATSASEIYGCPACAHDW